MKFISLALTSSLIALPALATPGGEGSNSNCQGLGNINSPCVPEQRGNNGNHSSNENTNTNKNTNNNINANTNKNTNKNTNSSENSNTNTNTSNATGGAGGQGGNSSSSSSSAGGQGGQGGQGGKGGYSSATGGNSSASGGNSSSSSRNNISNTSNSQSYYERETPVAPLLSTSDSAQMEGVTVPLPTIGISGFYSNGDNTWNDDNRNDVGVTLGLRLPLGGGQFREAALRREKFQIVKEAIFLQEKGVLTYAAFPDHYIALYGAPSPTDRPIK